MWELAANWHGKKNNNTPTHTQEIYIKQHKKCVFWDYLQWPRKGGGGGGGVGGWGPGGGGGGGGGWGGEESLITFWRTSLC